MKLRMEKVIEMVDEDFTPGILRTDKEISLETMDFACWLESVVMGRATASGFGKGHGRSPSILCVGTLGFEP